MNVEEFNFPAKLTLRVETKENKKNYSAIVTAGYHGAEITLPISDAEAVKEWIRLEIRAAEKEGSKNESFNCL